MSTVVLEGREPNGLAQMMAALIESNVAADPARARLLESARGAVQIDVIDAGVTVGLKFIPGTLTVASVPVAGRDLQIRGDANTIMGLSSVPLRFGLPDPMTEAGRVVTRQVLQRSLRIRMRPRGFRLLTRLNRLLNVAGP